MQIYFKFGASLSVFFLFCPCFYGYFGCTMQASEQRSFRCIPFALGGCASKQGDGRILPSEGRSNRPRIHPTHADVAQLARERCASSASTLGRWFKSSRLHHPPKGETENRCVWFYMLRHPGKTGRNAGKSANLQQYPRRGDIRRHNLHEGEAARSVCWGHHAGAHGGRKNARPVRCAKAAGRFNYCLMADPGKLKIYTVPTGAPAEGLRCTVIPTTRS